MPHPTFITFKHLDDLFVCQCKFPFYMAKMQDRANAKYWTMQVAGYELHLNFAGTLAGHFIPADPTANATIPKVLEQMAMFYLTERININPKRYAKHIIR